MVNFFLWLVCLIIGVIFLNVFIKKGVLIFIFILGLIIGNLGNLLVLNMGSLKEFLFCLIVKLLFLVFKIILEFFKYEIIFKNFFLLIVFMSFLLLDCVKI